MFLINRYANNVYTKNEVPANEEVLKVFKRNDPKGSGLRHIRWQYYGTEEGYTVNYPVSYTDSCSNYDPRIRFV